MNGVSGQPSPLTPPARHPLRPGTNSGSKTTNPASSLELASTSHPKDDRGQLPSYRNANLLAIPSFSTKDQGTQSSPASPPLAASGRHSLSAINLDPSQLPNGEAANPLQGLLDGRSPPQSPHSTPLKRSRVRPSPSFPERYRGSSDGETPGADRMSSVSPTLTRHRYFRLISVFYRKPCPRRPNRKAIQTRSSRLLSNLTPMPTPMVRCGDICFMTARVVLQFRNCRPCPR